MAAVASATPVAASQGEERFTLQSVDWRTYSVLRELLDSPGLRIGSGWRRVSSSTGS
jgi:hypothetical protein